MYIIFFVDDNVRKYDKKSRRLREKLEAKPIQDKINYIL